MRLDKQELIKGNISSMKKDTIKLKIHTPIYNKKETVKIFTEIFKLPTRLNRNKTIIQFGNEEITAAPV